MTKIIKSCTECISDIRKPEGDKSLMEIKTRVFCFGRAILHITGGAVDGATGISLGLVNLITGNTISKFSRISNEFNLGFKESLSCTYIDFLNLINPKAKCVLRNAENLNPKDEFYIYADGGGFFPEFTTKKLKHLANYLQNQNNFHKHVTARIIYLAAACLCPFARLGDAVIACVVAPISLITCGKYVSINNLAYRTLQFPGIVYDLHYNLSHFLNPGDYLI